ncbi:MAG: FecR domain-containing protein, partial [Acidobacteria bacterium]|nr:FecR domain-containing protein [Acidobacteriota bacterium]
MRSRLSAPTALLFLLSTLFLFSSAARADDETYDDDEYEERARVLRVSLLKGEVSLKRAGNDEWEEARLNAPLVEGDVLATGRASRLEIQADARNFVRVGPDSVLRVVTLRDEGIALSLSEGSVTFRLAQFDKDKGYFELDAPGTTVAAERIGQYRVDVERDGAVRVTVREDGRARIYSQNSGFVLRTNRTARLAPDGSGESEWDFMAAAGFDEWDTWNDERERYLASRLKFEGRDRYYDSDVYGAEELDAYGDWVYTKDYGYIWRPRTTVINVYNDWAPYRYGRWVWCSPYGWT